MLHYSNLRYCNVIIVTLIFTLAIIKPIACNENSTTVEDDHEHDDRDYDTPSTDKMSSVELKPTAVVESILKSAVGDIKPLIAKTSTDSADGDSEEYADEDDADDEIKSEHEFQPPKNANETISIMRLWSKLATDTVETVLKEFTPLGVQLSYDLKIGDRCASHFLRMFNGVRNQELWAFRSKFAYLV